jgi:hypothetical protein
MYASKALPIVMAPVSDSIANGLARQLERTGESD